MRHYKKENVAENAKANSFFRFVLILLFLEFDMSSIFTVFNLPYHKDSSLRFLESVYSHEAIGFGDPRCQFHSCLTCLSFLNFFTLSLFG